MIKIFILDHFLFQYQFSCPKVTKMAHCAATTISLSGFFTEKRPKMLDRGPKNDDFDHNNDLR